MSILQSFKRNIEYIFINVLFLIVAIIVFYLLRNKEIAAAILVTGISFSIGIKQLQVENDKMFKELFINFNSKYDTKFNNTLNNIDFKFNSNSEYQLTEEEKFIIIDYLNFCSEEYLWYSKNRIDECVWESWRNGMIYYLNIPVINSFILTQKGQANSYYGLMRNIGSKLNNWS